jgi:hypothetical protein
MDSLLVARNLLLEQRGQDSGGNAGLLELAQRVQIPCEGAGRRDNWILQR